MKASSPALSTPAIASTSRSSSARPSPVSADSQTCTRRATSCATLPARPREVGLVVQHEARQRRRQSREDRAIVRRAAPSAAFARVDDHQREVRAADGRPRAFDAEALDRVAGVAQPGGVDHGERNAADLDVALDGVARRAGHGRDDRDLVPREPVHQARLADVGPSRPARRRGRREQTGAGRRAREEPSEVRAHAASSRERIGQRATNSTSSSGKSSVASVNMRSSVTAPTIACTSRENSPGEAARGRARGGRARGVDQVGHALGLREVELAVQECALRELARLGEAGAELDAPREQQAQRRGAAVTVQLDHGLAGVGSGAANRMRQALVDRLAARAAKCRDASRRRGASSRPTTPSTIDATAMAGTGNAHDADPAAAGRRGDRGDRGWCGVGSRR